MEIYLLIGGVIIVFIYAMGGRLENLSDGRDRTSRNRTGRNGRGRNQRQNMQQQGMMVQPHYSQMQYPNHYRDPYYEGELWRERSKRRSQSVFFLMFVVLIFVVFFFDVDTANLGSNTSQPVNVEHYETSQPTDADYEEISIMPESQ